MDYMFWAQAASLPIIRTKTAYHMRANYEDGIKWNKKNEREANKPKAKTNKFSYSSTFSPLRKLWQTDKPKASQTSKDFQKIQKTPSAAKLRLVRASI